MHRQVKVGDFIYFRINAGKHFQSVWVGPELVTNIKAEDYSSMFSAPIKKIQCYASSHSDFHTNTCEVTMQAKRGIWKDTLHKLPIYYNEYLRLCWVSTLFCMIYYLFSNCSKSSTIRLYNVFPCVVNVPRSHVPVLLAMQWSVAWRSAFYRGREHLWIVFSFKYLVKKKAHFLNANETDTIYVQVKQ